MLAEPAGSTPTYQIFEEYAADQVGIVFNIVSHVIEKLEYLFLLLRDDRVKACVLKTCKISGLIFRPHGCMTSLWPLRR